MTSRLYVAILLLLFSTATFGQQEDSKSLDPKSKTTLRRENSQTFGGYTKTSIFYFFESQKTALKILIDNKSKDLPITGILYSFDKSVDEKAYKKWLNNQTSDALFADAPMPTKQVKVDNGFEVSKKSKTGSAKDRLGVYDKYKVEFKFVSMKPVNGFSFKTFKDSATVYIKSSSRQ